MKSYPYIYPTPEKGTLSGRTLSVQVTIGSTQYYPSPGGIRSMEYYYSKKERGTSGANRKFIGCAKIFPEFSPESLLTGYEIDKWKQNKE